MPKQSTKVPWVIYITDVVQNSAETFYPDKVKLDCGNKAWKDSQPFYQIIQHRGDKQKNEDTNP